MAKKRGRPVKENHLSHPMFTRVSEEHAEKFIATARRYRITIAELMRWIVEDTADGKWKPTHL